MAFTLEVGGEHIALDKGQSFAWAQTYGVQPNVSKLTTTKATVDAILARAAKQFPLEATEGTPNRTRTRTNPAGSASSTTRGPISILMRDDGAGREVKIEGLYVVVGNRPGRDYNTSTVSIMDSRWLLSSKFVERSYNIRRRTGDYRFVAGVMEPISKGTLTPDFAYRRSTLNELGEPWSAREVLEDVLEELVGPSGFGFDGETSWLDVPIEGLELHDYGDAALARVLSYVPGAQLYAAADGRLRIANIYDQSEEAAFAKAGSPNGGHWRKVDRSYSRPAAYQVFSDREVELRFDLVESTASLRSIVRGEEPLFLENVIINPLFELTLANGEVATQGEAIEVDDFIAAANLIPRLTTAPLVDLSLSRLTIQRHWLGLWETLRQNFAVEATGSYNEKRLRCLGALRNDWRRLYRLAPAWRDKVRAITNRRTAVFDFETGTSAPAAVHCSYVAKFTALGLPFVVNGDMGVNVDNYGDGELALQDSSPFTVDIVNSDIGMFRVSPTLDQTGTAEDYVLGLTKDVHPLPDGDGRRDIPKSGAGKGAIFWGDISLDDDFKIAVILTATPATPNGKGRLHREFVTIADVANKLGIDTPKSIGPIRDLVQSAEPARHGWVDAWADQIREAFYKGAEYPPVTLSNRHAMRELALAGAAADFASRQDRVEGQSTHPLQPIQPTGNLRAVVHSVSMGAANDLEAMTTLSAPGEVESPPLWSGLPEGLRRKIMGLIQL